MPTQVVVIGDYAETGEELEELLLLHLGTVQAVLPAEHPAVRHTTDVLADPLHAARRLPFGPPSDGGSGKWDIRKSEVTLEDEEPRAVINMLFRTIGFYGRVRIPFQEHFRTDLHEASERSQ